MEVAEGEDDNNTPERDAVASAAFSFQAGVAALFDGEAAGDAEDGVGDIVDAVAGGNSCAELPFAALRGEPSADADNTAGVAAITAAPPPVATAFAAASASRFAFHEGTPGAVAGDGDAGRAEEEAVAEVAARAAAASAAFSFQAGTAGDDDTGEGVAAAAGDGDAAFDPGADTDGWEAATTGAAVTATDAAVPPLSATTSLSPLAVAGEAVTLDAVEAATAARAAAASAALSFHEGTAGGAEGGAVALEAFTPGVGHFFTVDAISQPNAAERENAGGESVPKR